VPKNFIFLTFIIFSVGLVVWLLVGASLKPSKSPNVQNAVQQFVTEVEQVKEEIVYKKYGEYGKLTIPYLQDQQFNGSQITVEQTLNNGSNYSRQIASYQSEGLKINGLLTKPNTTMPVGGYPAIVFLHGYIPPNQYVGTQKYVAYVDYLAKNGFVVYQIDYRGHDKSEGEPGGAYFSADYVIDTINAAQSLKTLEYVDSTKINLWGHSMSGNVAMRSAASKPDLFSTVVVWAGAGFTYKDFFEYRISDTSYVRRQPSPSTTPRLSQSVREKFGEFNENTEFWQLMAPTNYLSNGFPPVQIHHSSNDDVVNVEYSRNLAKILSESNVSYEYHEYTVGGHNLNSPSFDQAMQKTVQFYNSY
jgi:dipeptidyl aminopeptidase/acylaminoacyl peptidase